MTTSHRFPIDDKAWAAASARQQGHMALENIIGPHERCTEPQNCWCPCGVCRKVRLERGYPEVKS